METAITTRVHVRFVAGVDERTAIHRVDADDHAEKIRALRNLINSRLTRTALAFDAHLSGAGENLAGDQERQNGADDAVPRHIAPHEIVVVATVTVPEEVGVVLVKANFLPARQF